MLTEYIKEGNEKGIKNILSINKAIVNQYNNNGYTALLEATIYKRSNCVDILLKYGANTNLPNLTSGLFPLHIAAQNNDCTIVTDLIAYGANVNVTTKQIPYDTPLHYASASNASNVIKILITNGANANLKNYYGMTPLQYASFYNANLSISELSHYK